MAYAMTKRGSLDNEITYEFICDTIADMNSIEPNYRTIGTVAIVLSGESEGLEVYIAGSDKQWSSLSAIGNSSSAAGGGLTIYICSQEEVDQGLPDIDEPDESVIYLVANSEDTNNLYDEYIYVNDTWEKFGSAGIDLSGYAPIANPNFTGSISLGRVANSTIGANSSAIGTNVVASGNYSHAEGIYTNAEGYGGHAEGSGNGTSAFSYSIYDKSTTPADRDISSRASYVPGANGNYTHVEGIASLANSVAGHAEGYYTLATGSTATHTEGYQTYAGGGGGEHAEGKYTYAQGSGGEHAEGEYTYAAGSGGAHAEGYKTMAVQKGSHSEGEETLASGQASHAEGTKSQASGNSAHAEGYETNAAGNYSHAEGYGGSYSDNGVTKTHGATGTYAHSEGMSCDAIGSSAHAEGYYNKASGLASHVEGYYSVASGDESHAEGYQTTASGTGSHAEGNGTSRTINGVSTKTGAIGSYSHSEGYNTTAYGNRSHAEGEGDTITYNGTTYLSGSRGQSSHSEGYVTLALGNGTHTEGYKTIAEMLYSHAEGYNSVVKNGGYSYAAHAEGNNTTASNDAAHSEGSNTIASGLSSHAEGSYTIASTNYMHVQGRYNNVSKQYIDPYYDYNSWAPNTAYEVGDIVTKDDYIYTCKTAHTSGETMAWANWSNQKAKERWADMVGNGTNNNNRSNAYALDWDGNEYLNGDLYVGCNADSTGGTKVATVSQIPDTSTLAPKASPVFTGSISLNRKTGTTAGTESIAVGNETAANGPQTVAFGRSTISNGDVSFTCGSGLVAAGGSEFVIGTYNKLPAQAWQPNTAYVMDDYVVYHDKLYYCASPHTSAATFEEDSGWYHAKKYLLTIGNGNNSSGRSNAFVVDIWGNAHLIGDLYVGCNDDSQGGTKLAHIPDPPSTDGTYTLQATVSNGTVTYTWVAGA